MTIPHRRQPERVVLLGIPFVADANQRRFEQLDEGGDDLGAGQSLLAHVPIDAFANARECAPERHHALVLRFVAHLTPPLVIPVLLATTDIASGCLNVAVCARADPDILPGRRDHERLDPRKDLQIGDATPLRIAIGKSLPGPMAGDTRPVDVGITEPCLFGNKRGIDDGGGIGRGFHGVRASACIGG